MALRMNPFTGKPEFIEDAPVVNEQTGQRANTAGQTTTAVTSKTADPSLVNPNQAFQNPPPPIAPFKTDFSRKVEVGGVEEDRTTDSAMGLRDELESTFQASVGGFFEEQKSFQQQLLDSLAPTAEEEEAVKRLQSIRAKQEQLASELQQTQDASEGRLVDISTIRGEQEQAARVARGMGLEFGMEERRALDDLTRITGSRQAQQEVLKTAMAFNVSNLDTAIELHKLFETEQPDAEIKTIGNKIVSIQDGVANVIYEGDPADDPEKFDNTVKLRKDFVAQSKDFLSVRDAYAKVLSTDATAAGDLGLIFNFMKMLDPGSVVREGEFANAQNAAGVPDRIRNQYNRLMTGERLSGNQRGDFRNTAANIYASQLTLQNQNREETMSLAESFGLEGAQVAPDLSLRQGVGGGDGGAPVVEELPEVVPISNELLSELGLTDEDFIF